MSETVSLVQLRKQTEKALALSDTAEAELNLVRGIKAFPEALDQYDDPFFLKEYIRLLLANRRWEEAEAAAAKAKEHGVPGWHHILFARALDSAGRKSEALEHWKAFQKTRPNHPEARAALARMSVAPHELRAQPPSQFPAPFRQILEQVPTQSFKMIFDVGANVGQSCLQYRKLFPEAEIHAFEPVPDTFEHLKQRTQSAGDITVHNVALSSSEGSLTMSLSNTSSMNRIGATRIATGEVEISAQRLDNFCRAKGIERINFLKIDTEGHDIAVLEGAGDFLHNIDFIQCEASANRYNKFHAPFWTMFDLLTDAGFYLFHIGGMTYEWGNGGYPVLRRFDPVFINGRVFGPMLNVLDQ